MSRYVDYTEWCTSAYGQDYLPGDSIFASSGEINEFLQGISSLIDTFCGRSFDIARYSQVYDSRRGDSLFVDIVPVTGIVQVKYENIGGSSGLIDPTCYYLFPSVGRIKFANTLYQDKIYTVTYDAGYATIPDQIRLATMMWANIAAQSIDNNSVAIPDGGAVTQFRFNKFWEAYVDPRQRPTVDNIPPTVYAILSRFRYLKGH